MFDSDKRHSSSHPNIWRQFESHTVHRTRFGEYVNDHIHFGDDISPWRDENVAQLVHDHSYVL